MQVSFKAYVRDQVRRNAERLSRPVRIVRGYGEYTERRNLTHAIPATDCYDLASLEANGYLVVTPPASLIDELLVASRNKLAAAHSLPQSRNKAFFSQLLGPEDLDPRGIFLRAALEERCLTTTAKYLGIAPFLESVELLHSKPIQGPPAQSQQWHKDRTDRKILKVFVYVNDVTAKHGPFSLLSRAESARVPDYLFHYLTDEEIAKYVDPSKPVTITGPAGTTIMVDSQACYHLGSRCQEPRLAYVAYYSSGFGYRPRENSWHVPADVARTLTPMQRFALGVG